MTNWNRRVFTAIAINVGVVLVIAVVAGIVVGFNNPVGVILTGVAASLLAWTITSFQSMLLDRTFEEHDSKTTGILERILEVLQGQFRSANFEEHNKKTTRILNVVTGRHLSLENVKRGGGNTGLRLKEYWAKAKLVRISGRANREFVRVFFSDPNSAEHQLRARVTTAENVRVQVLLLDPDSQAVRHLEERFPGSKKNIEDVLAAIGEFEVPSGGEIQKHGSSVEVRVTAEPLNTALAAVTGDRTLECILLMGMLYNGIEGFESEHFLVPDYVPPGEVATETLHGHCLANFDRTFERARRVFCWDKNGIMRPPGPTPGPAEHSIPPSKIPS